MTRRLIKRLVKIKKKKSGRDSRGRISVRHQGGQHKRYIRLIDWKRSKRDISGKVAGIEYDPNRSANIALIVYPDGEKKYIIAPVELKVGDKIISSEKAEIKLGNALPLKSIPVGVPIHNLEIIPGKGAQIVRGAGVHAFIKSKSKKRAKVKLPSGEIRLFSLKCWATIGRGDNVDHKFRKLKKAGDKRHRGVRPAVRGVAQHPGSHPHGGGEGRSPIGMSSPKSPWGKKTLGKKTRKRKKYSDKLIVSARGRKRRK